jgi:hypothetical protein
VPIAALFGLSQTSARFVEAARLRSSEVLSDTPQPACLLTTRKNRRAKERKRLEPLTDLAQIGGVKNGVNLDAAGCNQTTANVGKSGRLRLERWPSGRRRTPAKRVWG